MLELRHFEEFVLDLDNNPKSNSSRKIMTDIEKISIFSLVYKYFVIFNPHLASQFDDLNGSVHFRIFLIFYFQ